MSTNRSSLNGWQDVTIQIGSAFSLIDKRKTKGSITCPDPMDMPRPIIYSILVPLELWNYERNTYGHPQRTHFQIS